MLFNSWTYFAFFALIIPVYFLLHHRQRWWWLLLASYGFYMSWRPEYAALIALSTLVDYGAGIAMSKHETKRARKPWLILSLGINLGLLFTFKYLVFFTSIVQDGLHALGIEANTPSFDILLPVGISFYTFQTLSYTIDVYRGDQKVERHLGIFALYVAFFPQLIAGPIERSTTFLKQFYRKVEFELQRIVDGGKLILWGLFKKIVIADNLALFADAVFDQPEAFGGNVLILGAFAFMFQVYCDFSGYTDIAIGSARILGFDLSSNFDRPFFARSLPDVWRRWHSSLTNWINWYLYRPLRQRWSGKLGRYAAIYIVFTLIGFWHGAGWPFILFGVVHATLLSLFYLTEQPRAKLAAMLGLKETSFSRKIIDLTFTFLPWVFAGIFIRSNSAEDALYYISHLFDGEGLLRYKYQLTQWEMVNFIAVALGLSILFIIELRSRDLRNPFHHIRWASVRWSLFLLLIFSLILFQTHQNQAFYYFQF